MGDERIVVIVADDERILYAGRRPAYTLGAAERIRWSPSGVYAGRRPAYKTYKNDFNKSFCSKSFENCRLYSVLRRASCIIGQLNRTYT